MKNCVNILTRRSFLKLGTILGSGILLSPCYSALDAFETPLEHQLARAAQENNNLEVMRICRSGISVNCEIPGKFRYSEYEIAVMNAAEEYVVTDGKISPLSVAARFNSLDVMKQLLAFGADPNGIENEFQPPLMVATSIDAVRMLVDSGSDVTCADAGEIGSCLYTHLGNKEILSFLLKNGADLDRKNCCGSTVLGIAIAWHSSLEDIRYLVESGANIDDVGIFGESALEQLEGTRILNLRHYPLEDLERELREIEEIKLMVS